MARVRHNHAQHQIHITAMKRALSMPDKAPVVITCTAFLHRVTV
jgi:hypothetical protein